MPKQEIYHNFVAVGDVADDSSGALVYVPKERKDDFRKQFGFKREIPPDGLVFLTVKEIVAVARACKDEMNGTDGAENCIASLADIVQLNNLKIAFEKEAGGSKVFPASISEFLEKWGSQDVLPFQECWVKDHGVCAFEEFLFGHLTKDQDGNGFWMMIVYRRSHNGLLMAHRMNEETLLTFATSRNPDPTNTKQEQYQRYLDEKNARDLKTVPDTPLASPKPALMH